VLPPGDQISPASLPALRRQPAKSSISPSLALVCSLLRSASRKLRSFSSGVVQCEGGAMMKRIGAVIGALAVATIAWAADEPQSIMGPDWIDPATFRLTGIAGEDALLSWSDYRFDIDYGSLSAGLDAPENSGIGSSDDTGAP
jgi:hypothetical protein